MSDLYYTQRRKRAAEPPAVEVGPDFWAALRTYIDRLSFEEYFCKTFPDVCSCGGPVGRNDRNVARRLREELGQIDWPIAVNDPPESERILDLVEFFYKYVAKPTKHEYNSYCQSFHPEEYDVRQGRYDYTVQINQMLKRFNHPYILRRGRIMRVGSEVMDTRIASVEFKTNDVHLLKLLNSALKNYFDRSGSKKLEGLRSIVDAFERLKTIEDSNKKKSVTKVIGKLSPVDEVRSHFDAHLFKLTELANKYTIRHHERGKVVLDDEPLIDYLFYSYYNLVRLILEKYRMAE